MGLTRTELWGRLGLLKIVNPITDYAYEITERDIWLNDRGNSPHGEPWHTSFHASSFPGNDPYACGRKALYELMNLPEPAPTNRWLRGLGDQGKAIEEQLVKRWGQVGILLSSDIDEEIQTGFEDRESWLTGNCDAIVVPYGWNRGHVVEVKGKSIEVVRKMQNLVRGPDDKHVNQIKTYIGLANQIFHMQFPILYMCEETWAIAEMSNPDIENCKSFEEAAAHHCPLHGNNECLKQVLMKPVVDGTLYYVARDDPSVTHEFLFGHDPNFMQAGTDRLSEWKQNFEDGILPPRPDDWMWSKDPYPCRFCPFKKHVCKPDDKAGIENLEDSHGIEYAKSVRPNYDYEATRAAVLDRWNKEEQ